MPSPSATASSARASCPVSPRDRRAPDRRRGGRRARRLRGTRGLRVGAPARAVDRERLGGAGPDQALAGVRELGDDLARRTPAERRGGREREQRGLPWFGAAVIMELAERADVAERGTRQSRLTP